MTRFLTKSRYKLALECPTKLYYNDRSEEYANAKVDDPFLTALAEGGFQVGELAKCYYPDGVEIVEHDYETSTKKTAELLKQKNVIIFEAAVKFKSLFVRIDILEKKGNLLNLIEVKSKSADPDEFEDEIWSKKEAKKGVHSLKSDWKPYIYDVAFQAYVLKNAYPDFKVQSYLMCADKSTKASVDGLNQKFIIKKANGRSKAQAVGDVSTNALGKEILCKLPLDEVIDVIHADEDISERFEGKGFEKGLWYFAKMYDEDKRIAPKIGGHCKACEFRTHEDGKKCGFDECWNESSDLDEKELSGPLVFDVWNFRGSEKLIADKKVLMSDLEESDFIGRGDRSKAGLTQGERQWLQVQKVKEKDERPYLDKDGLREEMDKWVYPLHMIDFETCMVAIPFNKGRHPYEQIAFQFSHHMIHKDGRIEHADEYINSEPGIFPNFEFVRALKKAIGKDEGSIFRYANHENTVLCQIRDQLKESKETDRKELIEFIETVTAKKEGTKVLWEGPRDMIDLCEMVKKYYYSPRTHGSNSIKYVLPAILNESEYLKKKYARPIYGKSCEIKSKNFDKHAWIKIGDDGAVCDPYKTLPPIFDEYDYETLDLMMSDTEIRNGGAALTAYALMQFTQMSKTEREKIKAALLRYCELDTFAMVMIWEAWR